MSLQMIIIIYRKPYMCFKNSLVLHNPTGVYMPSNQRIDNRINNDLLAELAKFYNTQSCLQSY